MITSTWNNYTLSRLMLGTVQFGMPYGVANRRGQPDYRDVVSILAAAVEGGVNCFDTAAIYGNCEKVLGQALRKLGVVERVFVVTKVRPLNPIELTDSALASTAIEQSVANSRHLLGINSLPVVLFHREADAVHLNVLEKLEKRGWLRHAGVSCDNRPGPAAGFVAARNVNALQLPANVADPRHQRSCVFRDAAAAGIAVFIRSVYLQGLLVMSEADIPPPLHDIVPFRRGLTKIAGEGGMSLAELALRYMLSQAGVTCVLTGVETVAQVKDNLAIFERGPLSADMLKAIDAAATDLPEALVTPSMWPVPTQEFDRSKS